MNEYDWLHLMTKEASLPQAGRFSPDAKTIRGDGRNFGEQTDCSFTTHPPDAPTTCPMLRPCLGMVALSLPV